MGAKQSKETLELIVKDKDIERYKVNIDQVIKVEKASKDKFFVFSLNSTYLMQSNNMQLSCIGKIDH